jgi:demethylmenaquinone methyltransferase/2-methoxy-6-polyprenyl-1,4-benzoquinol methylase
MKRFVAALRGYFLRTWPGQTSEIQSYMDPIFARISGNYDLLTRLMSGGQDRRWKERALSFVTRDDRAPGRRALDLATGTGDFPLQLRQTGRAASVVGLDRNPEMLARARRKCAAYPEIAFLRADLAQIPFKDSSFQAITLGYGLRYVIDIRGLFCESRRLLSRGGVLVVLEFGHPRNALYRGLCFAYLFLLGSFCGLLLHGKVGTYWHIVESLRVYPGQRQVIAWLEEAGFREVRLEERLFGIVTILSAVRP